MARSTEVRRRPRPPPVLRTPTQNGQATYTIGVTATDKAGNSASDSISVLGVKTGKP